MNTEGTVVHKSDALECRRLGYQLTDGSQTKTLVSDLNLRIGQGETLVLLGRSGSGKTTTLKLLNRLLVPTSGEVFIGGKPAADLDPVQMRRGIGYVIQDAGLFPHWSVAKNVSLVPRLEHWPEEKIRARVDQMLELVGLPAAEFAERRPVELSGGQRQRVGVARALAADPPILLMDEPFGALDPVTRAELQKEFRILVSELKKTIVFVTHDLREALYLGTRITLLAEGRLVGTYSPEEFLQATSPEVRAFAASLHPENGNEAGHNAQR
jgi:osmoprotectant transport system ATP-binding protein